MSLEQTLKRVILPKNVYKTIKTVQFAEAGSQIVTTAVGNEGLDLLIWIQERINAGDLILTGADNSIQYQDEGVDLGTPVDITTIDFTGAGVSATLVGDTLTINVPGVSGSNTNLSTSSSSTTVNVNSDTGTDATLVAATSVNAGIMTAEQYRWLAALITLSGASAESSVYTSFTGITIPDNATIKDALQALETAVELRQKSIQFKDDGTNLGTSGTVDTINYTGAGVTATRVGNVVTVDVPGGSSASGLLEVESDNTLILYYRVSGSGVPSASRTGGVSTIVAPSGVKISSVSVKGQTSDLAGDNSFKILVNGVPGTSLLAYPTVSKWNLSGSAPSDGVPHIQDIDNTPGVQVTAGTAGSSITVKLINLNSFTNWVIKLGWS